LPLWAKAGRVSSVSPASEEVSGVKGSESLPSMFLKS
jgi:hypothetical protein